MYVAISREVWGQVIKYLETKPLPYNEVAPLLEGLKRTLPVTLQKAAGADQPKDQEERHGDQANDSQ